MTKSTDSLDDVMAKLSALHQELLELDQKTAPDRRGLSSEYEASARNLLHYVGLRRHDLRHLQERLASLGISSLGRSEGATLDTLQSVLRLTSLLQGRAAPAMVNVTDHAEGHGLLEKHTQALLGPPSSNRHVRIMVTMPGEAAENVDLIRELLAAGMDCMRINCSHDDEAVWKRMIDNLRQAESKVGKKCRVLMDLGGPKLRSGPLPPGPKVVKVRPTRDELGCVDKPANVWLTSIENRKVAPMPCNAILPVPEQWLNGLKVGDEIKLRDARKSKRRFVVTTIGNGGCFAEALQTAYVTTGTKLRLSRVFRKNRPLMNEPVAVGELPEHPLRIHLQEGDTLIVTRKSEPGTLSKVDIITGQILPAQISCTLPQIFSDVQQGESIWFDDGKIGGVIREVNLEFLRVEITQADPGGDWLGADKGINLPDTKLRLPALTDKDIADLDFVTRNADLVGYSFVRDAQDVNELRDRLRKCGRENLGIVLKIETRRAFENLPEILLAAMRGPCLGVMIARGDLAVECGFERLAEVQEEILWICEAAHAPVIWATQVLENLAKQGRPSRAEITDAAMGERAECVMLNKGPHIVE
ncbi:MAG: pyruvate kinase, partial [Planctomycetes bacterium]|nr:pyruvate kinase [Planctomycetota bacterium]